MAEPQGFNPEQLSAPENSLEHNEIPAAAQDSRSADQQPATTAASVTLPQTRPAPVPMNDPIQKEVEIVMSENIADIYKQLPADRKSQFKLKGEEVAAKITAMIKGGLMQIKKILHLIREWLSIIPGVNKFFLEQEAKIKTDKIQEIYEREHSRAL